MREKPNIFFFGFLYRPPTDPKRVETKPHEFPITQTDSKTLSPQKKQNDRSTTEQILSNSA